MAILSTAKVVGMLASAKKTGRQVMNAAGEWVVEVVEDFMSGFAGHGWKIWEYVKGKWMLEIDSIRVREQFIVFEMLVSKMRAIIGSLGISQACGKIATVTLSEDGAEYLITLEDETMSFVAHDFMRCQTYTGTKQTFYHVEISSVVDDIIHVPVSEFDKDEEGNVINPPKVGNDIVQFGNSVNKIGSPLSISMLTKADNLRLTSCSTLIVRIGLVRLKPVLAAIFPVEVVPADFTAKTA